MSEPATPQSTQSLESYFKQMHQAFALATAQGETLSSSGSVAGHQIEFHIIGESLRNILCEPLAHLSTPTDKQPGFTLYAWDEKATGISLPPAPWKWPTPEGPAKVALPLGCENFRLMYHLEGGALILYNCETCTAMMWTRDVSMLPLAWHGAPLLDIFHGFFQDRELYLLHAGCVGTENGAVILAGKGGSGKSTTSLLCLEAGMKYLSDDYCLYGPGTEPRGYCLYNTGKLHRNHIHRLPSLAARAVDPHPEVEEKKIIYAHQLYPDQITPSLPLRAILLPKVCPQTHSLLVPINPVEALRGLAPSTLFQLPGQGAKQLRTMSALVRQIPCYRLELGSDFQAIPEVVRSVLT